ncbi:polar amino acid transport system substrate-binding protein [Andreprevotia lacus DSM 23236]|uniref:Polar amino acid transport system substrate-binding protein n=1 Tax=Andreprevotia lacus DSM 23236 TaxID=1121001 RepID=A0A1W1XER1_9NEIS|nr:amino acid ABC transporter substrate-binding protein [Andreprevotia lacus]SMC22001.1 polar amino acid transport system substrate-binding protein [Andreprevotia lacus DSM 23236]
MVRFVSFLLIALLATPLASAAVPVLVICTLDQPFLPFTHPDGSGLAQQAIRNAAAGLPVQLKWVTAPRRRCVADLSTNTTQGLVAAYDLQRTAYTAYPMRNGQPDRQRNVAMVRVRFYVRSASPLSWDGNKLGGVADPLVGVQAGFVYANDLLQHGIRADEGAPGLDAQFAKLANGRVDAVAAMENEAAPLIAQRYPGQIRALEPVFEDIPLYLAVSLPFYQQNRALVETIWSRLAPPPRQPASRAR